MSRSPRPTRLLRMRSFSARTGLVALVLLGGCYTAGSVLDRADAGTDAGSLAHDAGPRPPTDAFVAPVDSPPPSLACSATAPCGAGTYCDFGDGCGGPGAIGTCSPISYCPPVGGIVCGCDGRDYLSACEAHAAGTATASGTGTSSAGCTAAPPSDRLAVVTRECAPGGGPAWTFTIAGTDTACGDTRPGVAITLYADLAAAAPGTAFDLDTARVTGVARSCPSGLGAACITLEGIVVVDAFDEGVGASITYGLAGQAGTRDAPIEVRLLEHAVAVGSWCSGAPSCP